MLQSSITLPHYSYKILYIVPYIKKIELEVVLLYFLLFIWENLHKNSLVGY